MWKFPDSLGRVCGYHHRPLELDPDHRTLTGLVYVADHLAVEAGIGYSHTVDPSKLDERVLDDLKLSQNMLERVREALPDVVTEAEDLLS